MLNMPIRPSVLGARWRALAVLVVSAGLLAATVALPVGADGVVSISGRVTDEETGLGLVGVYVYAESLTHDAGSAAFTDADGYYAMPEVPPGDYTVGFVDLADVYVEEYWKDAHVEAGAAVVQVSGDALVGIDASLLRTGSDPTVPDPTVPDPTVPGGGGGGAASPGGGVVPPVVGGETAWPRLPRGLGPIERAVARLYLAYFRRLHDEGGLAHWSAQIRSGRLDLDAVSAWFARSPEFRSTYGGLSSAGFVRLAYRNVLDREPDRSGFEYWSGRLATGLSPGQLMVGFSESPEFVRRTAPPP